MKQKILLFGALFSLSTTLTAQVDLSNTRQGESVEYCLHHKKMEALRSNPAFLQQFIQDQNTLRQIEMDMLANPNPQRVIYKIPIVFHVLHNNGIENITNEQILNALDVLNRDYRKLNADTANVHPDFLGMPADIEIEFVLATKAPNGTCFNGITRTQSSLSYVTSSQQGVSQVNAIIQGNNIYNGEWPGNKYLNVFICGDIGGAAGYTYTPSNWAGSGMDNGIWILHDYVGNIGTGNTGTDRALTHEVGHWLNLEHTWGPNNNPGNASSCSSDDGVTDTPNTIGVTSCNRNENSCGPRANVENYMDYSYCSKMFTTGQKNRMRAALNSNVGGRSNLWTTNNIIQTGADGNLVLCTANFDSDVTEVCPGGTVQFSDQSFNNVSSWNWSFPGATVTSSTEQNPVVTYNTPGTYNVSLTVSDGSVSLTKTLNNYITVNAAGISLPYSEGFENLFSIGGSTFWSTVNEQNNAGFQVTSNAAFSGSKSLLLNNFTQLGNSVDELIGSDVDLSGIQATNDVTLSFKYAYRKKSSGNNEKLFILFSGNCGQTWEIRKSIVGNSLSSVVQSTSFTPSTASDWTTVHVVNITSQYWNSNFRWKFRFEGSGGNNFYLDNINIYQGGPVEPEPNPTSSINEIETIGQLITYPNPTENELTIEFSSLTNQNVSFVLHDLLGQELMSSNVKAQTGNNLVFIPLENFANGQYLLTIKVNNQAYTQKIIKK